MKYYYSKSSQSENFFSTQENKKDCLKFYENKVTYNYIDVEIPERIEEINFWEYMKGINHIRYVK